MCVFRRVFNRESLSVCLSVFKREFKREFKRVFKREFERLSRDLQEVLWGRGIRWLPGRRADPENTKQNSVPVTRRFRDSAF